MFFEIVFIGCAISTIVATIKSRQTIKLRNAPTMDICKKCRGLTRGDAYCNECNKVELIEYRVSWEYDDWEVPGEETND